ncbi:molybdate ABC transporter substrate-binding protein (plasmid) [Coraliomargarita sp. W4R53]
MMRSSRRSATVLAGLVLLTLSAGGCAAFDASDEAFSASPDSLEGDLTIFAAASLGAAFDELALKFEAQHPAVEVNPISYDGSSVLATQLVEGAPADIFAAADEKNMARVVGEDLASDPQLFASNTLVIVVPAANPGAVNDIDDLANPDLSVVLCAPEVPCGAASQTLLGYGDVHVVPASIEQNVTAVLTKVAAGEADAGLVYATDVQQRTDVDSIVPEGADTVVNHYPIAALDDADEPAIADAFIAFVLSPEGQSILDSFGFGRP